jgi:predicted GTPase
MSQTPPNLLELAKQGDAKAIASLMNQKLQPDGISAKASQKNDCLKVVLEAAKVPNQQALVAFVLAEMIGLEVKSIRTVKVYGLQQNTFDFAWHQEFELEEQVESPSASANSTGANTQASSQVGVSRKRVSESEFKESLEQCSLTAQKAYTRTVEYTKQTESILQKLSHNLSVTTSQLLNNKDSERFEFAGVLREIVSELKQLSTEEIEALVSSLDTKRKHLEDFTIALFGRTKAGKSTIREALTHGDGGTIGKGAQRTTRDVREYRWQGLRLLDTPGIEAYQGEEDTAQANEVIDQSDMILFLASDDSVQPGEFKAMGQLQQINKYFAVILNIKDNIEKKQRLIRFIKRPEKVFDQQRLSEHQNHITTYVKEHLGIANVDIVCVHALAAFLSTKPEYTEDSQKLLELSQVEELYYLIAYEIHNNGQKLRVSTFFDSAIKPISDIESKFFGYQCSLKARIKFIHEKKLELKSLINGWEQESNLKIENECRELYSAIKQRIPDFVDNYAGKDEANKEWKKMFNPEKNQTRMEAVIKEIVENLQETVKEFDKQYQYDVKSIQINLDSFGFDNFKESEFGRFLRRAGVVAGAVAAAAFVAANWWNPGGWIVAAGWVATGVGLLTGVAAEQQNTQEKREFQKQCEELKVNLTRKVDRKEQENIDAYKKWLYENITLKTQNEIQGQLATYINGLSRIIEDVAKSASEIKNLKLLVEKELSDWN